MGILVPLYYSWKMPIAQDYFLLPVAFSGPLALRSLVIATGAGLRARLSGEDEKESSAPFRQRAKIISAINRQLSRGTKTEMTSDDVIVSILGLAWQEVCGIDEPLTLLICLRRPPTAETLPLLRCT